VKRSGVLVLLLTGLASALIGQQQPANVPDSSILRPTSAQVTKFMEAMQTRSRLLSSLQTQREEIGTRVHNMFHKALPDATPAEKTKFENIVANSLGNIFANYPIDDVLRDMIPIYQSHFSESDLTQIISFYSSPVGQKVLREMPTISAELVRVSDARLQPQIDDAMRNVAEGLQEMVDAEGGKTK
jgi:uncharacterized protein